MLEALPTLFFPHDSNQVRTEQHRRTNLVKMSIPSVSAGRVGLSMVTTLARPSVVVRGVTQGGPAQLVRLNSSLVRPSCGIQSQTFQSHNVRPSAVCLHRPAGLRVQSTAAPKNNEVKLDWDSFFKLRASRRRYSLASSIITSLVSTSVGVQVLAAQDLEALGTQVMGLDPFVVLGLATAACGAVGWLMGPAVGNGVWGLVYRRYKPSVATVSHLPVQFVSKRKHRLHENRRGTG